MNTLKARFGTSSVVVDERDHIGPHHLAIGKTRKLFARDGIVHAFFSRGYEIGYVRLCVSSLERLDVTALSLPVAWGGGAFCVDDDGEGGVRLVFLHRNQHELCVAKGVIEDGRVRFEGWQSLLVSAMHQAAPWLEIGPDGTGWASVLDRSGDFRLAVIPREGAARIGDLFHADEARWYHSCVQVVPVSAHEALAISFRGAFPAKTELIFKTVSSSLDLGPAQTLASCNVNDHLTFHFQALGDAARGVAHIVYQDDGLSISHAKYENGAWTVTQAVLPMACYSPQICSNESGGLVLIAADYEGAVWTAAWNGSWSAPRRLDDIAGPNISAHFGLTGYGTGGLIVAKRAWQGQVPFLFARILDDATATARLEAAVLGHGDGLLLAKENPLAVTVADAQLKVSIGLAALRSEDIAQDATWCVTIPADAGRALKLLVTATHDGIAGAAFWLERDGTLQAAHAPVTITPRFHDAFTPGDAGLDVALSLSDGLLALKIEQAWIETYRGVCQPGQSSTSALSDMAPCPVETAAQMALEPARIPYAFKRMM
jgi:hypothetical protein